MNIGKLLHEGSNSCEDFEWEDMNEVSPHKFKTGFFLAKVSNFGWRKLDGHKYIKADKMTSLISGILPDTECNFKIHNWGKGFAVQNFHHDSCGGDEWYYIKPISETTYRRNI